MEKALLIFAPAFWMLGPAPARANVSMGIIIGPPAGDGRGVSTATRRRPVQVAHRGLQPPSSTTAAVTPSTTAHGFFAPTRNAKRVATPQ